MNAITTYGDAMALLMALEMRFGAVHAALVIDDDGCVLDGVALTLDWHPIDHALTYALLAMRTHGEHALLFTVGKGDRRLLDREDREAYDALQERCDRSGVHLTDWLVAGGGWYRSMQLATGDPEDRFGPEADWCIDADYDG